MHLLVGTTNELLLVLWATSRGPCHVVAALDAEFEDALSAFLRNKIMYLSHRKPFQGCGSRLITAARTPAQALLEHLERSET